MTHSKWVRVAFGVCCMLLVLGVLTYNNDMYVNSNRGIEKKTQSTKQIAYESEEMMTVDEKLYVKFGDLLNKSKSFERDDDYLHYIRSMTAKHSSFRSVATRPLSEQSPEATNGRAADQKLKRRTGGFFIEAGAADGFVTSHTLFLEIERNYTGLLVEANHHFVKQLLTMNRKAYVFDGCLSAQRRPQYLEFTASALSGGFESAMNPQQQSWAQQNAERYRVTCFPVTDILRAIGVNHVDFFSLDIQGAELDVLKTIDFEKFRFDILMIEVEHPNADVLSQLRHDMRMFFNGTRLYKEVAAPNERDLRFDRIDLAD